jgi:hypothetical protein
MRAVTNHLDEKAQSIFADLGYTVTREGGEYRAERKWRVVYVTPVDDPEETPNSGQFRCFVTRSETVTELRDQLTQEDPDYEWAIIGVTDDGDHEVASRPSAA